LLHFTDRKRAHHSFLGNLGAIRGALDIPLYKLFYSGEGEAPTPNLTRRESLEELAAQPGKAGEEARFLVQFKKVLAQLAEPDRDVVLTLARKLATR